MSAIRRKFIIVADDYLSSAEVFAEFLREFSVREVTWTLNGAEALAVARERRPDVCVLDIEMPVMGGIEAAQQLHSMFGEGRPVIIAMSGREVLAPEHSALFDLFLVKPCAPEAVLDFIDPPTNTDDEFTVR